jgi:serralysin
MRRIMVAVTLVGAALVLAAGVAFAATVECEPRVFCEGTNQPDKLIGTDRPDEMDARQDDDRLLGFRGGDIMFGDDRNLPVTQTRTDGDDELFAVGGEDVLFGFGGSDLLRGGGQADFIIADDSRAQTFNPGEDTVRGDSGADEIFAQDGYRDTIYCGAGKDTVFFDRRLDEVAGNCETRNPPATAAEAKAQSLASLSLR